MKSFLRVFKMLRPDSAATGILILSFLIHMERRLMKKKFPGKVYFIFLHFDAKARTTVRFFTDIMGSNYHCEKNVKYLIIVIVIILTL